MNSINHIAEHWPEHAVYSEDPYNSLWRELLHFGGRDAAERAMSLAPDNSQIGNFRNAIKLADAFWVNFEDADEDIDAVPLYYGALWLGMACAYASLAPSRLADIEQYHGLTLTPGKAPQPFLNSTLGIQKTGAFSRINEAFGGESFAGNITVADLIVALPQIIDDLHKVSRKSEAIHAEPPGYMGAQFESEKYPDKLCVARIGASFPLSDVSLRDHLAVGAYLAGHGLKYEEASRRASWAGTRERFEEISQLCIDTPDGFFFLPKLRSKVVAEFSIFLMILYALSVFVRYNPNTWLSMVENQTDEHFLIRSFILVAKNQIPQIALNHLTRESWIFRTRE